MAGMKRDRKEEHLVGQSGFRALIIGRKAEMERIRLVQIWEVSMFTFFEIRHQVRTASFWD